MQTAIKALFILLMPFFFTACTKYIDVVNIDKTKVKYLEATEKGELYNSLDTIAIISATYMNQIYPSTYKEGETFLAGVYYPAVTKSSENLGLRDDVEVYLLSNGKKYKTTSVEHLKPNDPLLVNMPLFSSWNDYYLVSFDKVEGDFFDLIIHDSAYGTISLHFKTR